MPDTRPNPGAVHVLEDRIATAHALFRLDGDQQARIASLTLDRSRAVVAPDESTWSAIRAISDDCMAVWSSDPEDGEDEPLADLDDAPDPFEPDPLGPAANELAMALFAFARGQASGEQHALTTLYFSQAIGGAIFAAQVAVWMRDEPDSYTAWTNHDVPATTVSTTKASVELGRTLWTSVETDLRRCDPFRNTTDQDIHHIDPEFEALTTAWKDAAFEVTESVAALATDAPGPSPV